MSKSTSPSSQLEAIDTLLGALIQSFADGRWEEIEQHEKTLLPLFVSIRDAEGPLNTRSLQDIEQLKKKLDHALELCKTRQEQIAPLIKAFERNAPTAP